MPYIGVAPAGTFGVSAKDRFSGDGSTTAFTMSLSPGSVNKIDVFVDNVRQEPTIAYTVGGTTLTFTAAPDSGTNNIYVVHRTETQSLIPPDDIVLSPSSIDATGNIVAGGLIDVTGNIDSDGDIFGATLNADGDTSAGDNAAIGFTAAEGLILTGQGSTSDVTIKNDADTAVIQIPTGGTAVSFAGNVTIAGNIDVTGSGAGAAGITSASSSGTAISIDSSNRVTLPSQPAFLAVAAAAQSNMANDATIVLGTEVFDVGSNFSSNTFTAPITGKYQLNASIRLENVDSASTVVYMNIVTSNRNYSNILTPPDQYVPAAGGGFDTPYLTISVSSMADMDANDTALVKFFYTGGAQQVDTSENGGTSFSGALIC